MTTPERIGKYQIVGKLGQGAMGEVYKAHDPVLNRFVAIKTISSGARRRRDAAEALPARGAGGGQLNHPNIVTVYEFGEERGSSSWRWSCSRASTSSTPWRQHKLTPRREAPRDGADQRGARLRPRAGRRPPRPEARQHPPAAERPGQDHGLRPGPPERLRHDAGRAW